MSGSEHLELCSLSPRKHSPQRLDPRRHRTMPPAQQLIPNEERHHRRRRHRPLFLRLVFRGLPSFVVRSPVGSLPLLLASAPQPPPHPRRQTLRAKPESRSPRACPPALCRCRCSRRGRSDAQASLHDLDPSASNTSQQTSQRTSSVRILRIWSPPVAEAWPWCRAVESFQAAWQARCLLRPRIPRGTRAWPRWRHWLHPSNKKQSA